MTETDIESYDTSKTMLVKPAKIACMLTVLATIAFAQESKFTRSVEVAPVRMSYEDLVNILSQAHQLLDTANASTKETLSEESLKLKDGEITIELGSNYSSSAQSSAPPVVYEIDYSYRKRDAPLSFVWIHLSDNWRQITVEGASRAQVEALSAMLYNKFADRKAVFAGPTVRNVVGLFFFYFGIFLLAFVSAPLPRRLQIAMPVIGVLIIVCVLSLPWKTWLPGTAMYQGDASFMSRHSPELTFIGTIVTILVASASAFRALFASRAGHSHTAEPSPEKEKIELL